MIIKSKKAGESVYHKPIIRYANSAFKSITTNASEDKKLEAPIFAKFFFDEVVPPGYEFEREKRFALKDLILRDDVMA